VSTSQQRRQHRPVVQEPAERALCRARSPWARLHVLKVGSGEPVLLVHGTGGTGPYWAPLVCERPDFEHDHQEDAWRQAATR
jgi:pimeloyl-ACP methyl ester carboxylesterase